MTAVKPIVCQYNPKMYISNYGYMNEWMQLSEPGHLYPKTGLRPQLLRRKLPTAGCRDVTTGRAGREEPSSFIQPVNEDKYLKMYRDMSSNIALRYPNPGLPASRSGSMGANWRNVKQVTQHGGTPILYLDGLVGHYDRDNVTSKLARYGEMRTHVRSPLYCPNQHDLSPEPFGHAWIEDLCDTQKPPPGTQPRSATMFQ